MGTIPNGLERFKLGYTHTYTYEMRANSICLKFPLSLNVLVCMCVCLCICILICTYNFKDTIVSLNHSIIERQIWLSLYIKKWVADWFFNNVKRIDNFFYVFWWKRKEKRMKEKVGQNHLITFFKMLILGREMI